MDENPYENKIEFALRYGELDELPGPKSHRKLISILAIACVAFVGIISLAVTIRNNNLITISFNADGGSSVEDIVIDKGSTIKLPVTTRAGYEFEGWYRNGTKVSEDIEYDISTVLTARWLREGAETFLVDFDSKGGSTVESLRVECGDELRLPSAPKRDGYSFVTWIDKNETPILDGALLACEDILLTAKWTKGENKVEGPDKITLDQKTVNLTVGDTWLLVATTEPANAKNSTVIWTSNDPEVVSVDTNGLLTAHKIGEAVITAATINGKSETAVVYSDINSITIKASSDLEYITNYGSLDAQKSIDFTVTTFPEIPLEDSDFTWESSNTSGIAAVASLNAKGTSGTLTANTVSGNDIVPVTITVSVGRVKSEEVTIYVEPKLILNGEDTVTNNQKLTVTASTAVSEWNVRAKEGSTVMTLAVSRGERKIVVKPTLVKEGVKSSPLVITAITRAGQKVDFNADCVAEQQ